MAELPKKKKGIEELLEKIPIEKCWEITARTLLRFSVWRGSKSMPTLLGKEEGILSPVWGWEKWIEILTKIMGDGAKRFYPRVKETFNVPVEDAIEISELAVACAILQMGPEFKFEVVEESRERVVGRTTKCAWNEMFNELEVPPELRGGCHVGCTIWVGEGVKAVNSKVTVKRTKSMHRGDPYCEWVYELKEE